MHDQDLSAAALGRAAYVESSVIRSYLTGRRDRARDTTLAALARALGVSIDTISEEP